MQLTDIRGRTVATLDLDSNSVAGWSVYDSFGNPQTSQTNTNLINYSSYGQQERATNTTGLILMGARVYNPETSQFTSKDPIKGGNENSYTYPNDPINGNDFSGLWDGWDTLDLVLTVASFIPIPGLQQAAWVGKAISIGNKVAKVAKGLLATSKAAKTVEFVKVTELALAKGPGVYEFTVKGKKYIGQTTDVTRRMKEHDVTYKGQIENFVFHEMPGKTVLERRTFEQTLINQAGGLKCRGCNPNLINKINSIKQKG
jgi:RHS repeat-associated protein